MTDFQLSFICPLPNGLHARPATELSRRCQAFECDISLLNHRSGERVDAKSMLALVGSDTLHGDSCVMSFAGPQAESACQRIGQFVEQELADSDAPLDKLSSTALELPPSLTRLQPQYHRGTTVAKGLGEGRVCFSHSRQLEVFVCPADTQEWARWQRSWRKLELDLREKLDNSSQVASEQAQILDAQLAMLLDPGLQAEIEQRLSTQSLGEALVDYYQQQRQQLERSSSAYLRERVLDIEDLCWQLLCIAYPEQSQSSTLTLSEPSVLVAQHLTPSEFIALDKTKLRGLVLVDVGPTSHTAILARAFDIPCISLDKLEGVALQSGEMVQLLADYGVLIYQASKAVRQFYRRARKLQQAEQLRQKQQIDSLAGNLCLEVAANVASDKEVKPAIGKQADGVGLFRSELVFMERDCAPTELEQVAIYSNALKVAKGKPVIFRTLDAGGDKPIDYLPLPEETNPFLGYRAVRIYPQYRELFETQLRALLRAALHGNARIMIPMVNSLEELRWVKQLRCQVEQELLDEQIEFAHDVPLGIMLEVPSCAFILDALCAEADFFSIGSNDMTQYLLAVDRDNPHVAGLYQTMVPAFINLLQTLSSTCQRHQRWLGLCGEIAANPRYLPLFVGAGLTELSMSAGAIMPIKATLASLDVSDCQMLFTQACQCATQAELEALLSEWHNTQAQRGLMDEGCVFDDADFTSKEDAIHALVGNLVVEQRCEQAVALEQDVWAREMVFSTGLGNGFAIPHTKSEHIASSTISIAKLAKPIDWQDDGPAIEMIILLTLNKQDSDRHMQIFSKLARKLVHEEFRQQLLAAPSASEILDILYTELGEVLEPA
ncbi:phosphoenolpyruvate--protein phosphotransferase [Aliagarivorans taiwanensis]|uniref:phosphoenolpyruvate--protein phosphotransferase n=1 Tax=Aliagarivorans taiwanensis TaxID=561966 RepID=UPI0003FE5F05|nr:phosphoenolpyruvate--protein phosphotransferase [Aliagarivorans taiwanensis]